jgi:hypothetical protein
MLLFLPIVHTDARELPCSPLQVPSLTLPQRSNFDPTIVRPHDLPTAAEKLLCLFGSRTPRRRQGPHDVEHREV